MLASSESYKEDQVPRKSLGVNPLAEQWPMLPADELNALAEDIAANGLLSPITLDGDGRILEGRNRHAACLAAKVEPTFATYEGDDPLGFILSMNDRRRHMTKGARAIVIARMAQMEKSSIRGWKAGAANGDNSLQRMLSDAETILAHSTANADSVVAGTMTFSKALDEAREAKANADERVTKLERLRDSAPDLAAQVDDERLTLGEAMAAAVERRRKYVEVATLAVDQITAPLVGFPEKGDASKIAERYLANYDPDVKAAPSSKTVRHVGTILIAIADQLERDKGA